MRVRVCVSARTCVYVSLIACLLISHSILYQIIITNFDFFYHDFREYLDPTGGHILNPRRVVAQVSASVRACV